MTTMRTDEYERMYGLEDSHWWYIGQRRIFNRLLERYCLPGDRRVLDAGCGTGGTLGMLDRWGEVVGCDSSPEAIGFCRRRGGREVVAASVTELPFDDNFFDMVTSFDVLYCLEVEERRQAVAEFERVLKPGGFLALNIPAYNWLRSQHDEVIGTKHRFNRREVVGLMRAGGFTPQKVSYWNTFLFPAAAAVRLLKKLRSGDETESDLKPVTPLLNRIFTGILFLESGLLRYVNFPFGLSILAVAKKYDKK